MLKIIKEKERKKKQKISKTIRIITYHPKTFDTVDIRSVITEHPKLHINYPGL